MIKYNNLNKICVVAPIHHQDDVRIYQKEILTLINSGYKIVFYARPAKISNIDNLFLKNIPDFKSRGLRFLYLPILLLRIIWEKSDLYHFHNPDTLPLAFICKLLGKRVIYDTHEDFSKRILMREWISKPIRGFIAKSIGFFEQLAGYFFNATIITQEEIFSRIKKTNKIHLIENSPLAKNPVIERAYQIFTPPVDDHKYIRVIYIGLISKTRGLFEFISFLDEINKTIPVRLWLIGNFSPENFKNVLLNINGNQFVDYLGYLPQEEALSYVLKSDIGLVTILDIGDHNQSSPNKLYEYMVLGKPFIASNFNKWKRQLANIKAGIFVDPTSCSEMTEAILQISKSKDEAYKMGLSGKKFIETEYNWENESAKLIQLYDQVLKLKYSRENEA